MTAQEFRELALNLKGAEERSHMNHPDFRAHGRIFATMGYPDESFAMVKLRPDDQKHFVETHPQMFRPVKGAWGLQGSTNVMLAQAKSEIVAQALDLAWQESANAPAKKAAKERSTGTKSIGRTLK
ncbi:MmcQ/YjbR family DNA-binding protein [Acidicapsa dinghuensis]|uniref:MmcQ/YjbR family DNA-binding protein n=1 Tax=Acidicapsa dinghuensis TaxID=2218256 RepID=A0ABW1EG22_9BACT|nr:MmcQ/YjbR family DNA-binding protein [Acidicapsa dinghuensis]